MFKIKKSLLQRMCLKILNLMADPPAYPCELRHYRVKKLWSRFEGIQDFFPQILTFYFVQYGFTILLVSKPLIVEDLGSNEQSDW